jgi:hypothetical protein
MVRASVPTHPPRMFASPHLVRRVAVEDVCPAQTQAAFFRLVAMLGRAVHVIHKSRLGALRHERLLLQPLGVLGCKRLPVGQGIPRGDQRGFDIAAPHTTPVGLRPRPPVLDVRACESTV